MSLLLSAVVIIIVVGSICGTCFAKYRVADPALRLKISKVSFFVAVMACALAVLNLSFTILSSPLT